METFEITSTSEAVWCLAKIMVTVFCVFVLAAWIKTR